ncbi:MAG: aminotransferase class V-fold PLP-dependent enzyme [Prolixibacteraceae bacterium]
MKISYDSGDLLQPLEVENSAKTSEALFELERGMYAALETYSNVHRGSGHFSLITTQLFEQARDIVLEYLELKNNQFTVIFCSPRNAELFKKRLHPDFYKILSSQDFGLSFGVRALAVKKSALKNVIPFHTGGGTARLISKEWVVWAKGSDKYEAGTPPIIPVIAFVKALQIVKQSGKDIFQNTMTEKHTASGILYPDELEKISGNELLNELRKTHIGQGVSVTTKEGSRSFINLDNSASTPTFTPVWNAFRQTLYQSELVQREIIEEVKSIISKLLHAPKAKYDVIFTTNTTEAINLVAENLSLESGTDHEFVVLNTLLEHSSNDLPWRMIPNCTVIRLSVNDEGFIDLKELEDLLIAYNLENKFGRKRIGLVAISGASNVLGVCNNLEEISRLSHKYTAQILVDGAQLVAHRKVDMDQYGIDYLAFSGHKVYAPFGCGVLVARKGLLNFNSEELELIRTSGEENVGGIAALGKALELLQRIGMDLIEKEERILTRRVILGLKQIQDLEIYGIKNIESPNFRNKIGVISFSLKNKMATQVGKELALFGGIGVRTGCHCAHITVKHILQVGPSLERFQKMIVTVFPKISLPGVARVSFGIENCEDDVDTFIRVLAEIAGQAQLKNDGTVQSDANENQIRNKAELQRQMNDFIRAATEKVFK